MNLYNTTSTDELLEIIADLKNENACLREQLNLSIQAVEEKNVSLEVPVISRFKEKYAIQILDSLPDMLTVISNTGILVDLVSSEETNHVGAAGDNLLGKDISEVVPPEAYRNIKNNLDKVVQTNECSVAHHDLFVDGEIHHYENRIFPLDKQYTLCMCRDVTESVNSQTELELANQRMVMAENIASLSHWYFYQNTQELEGTGILPQLVGKDKNESVRCHLNDYLVHVHPGDSKQLLEQLFADKITENEDDYVEHRITMDGKVKYLHTRTIRIYEKDGDRIVEGYVQDMTYIVERFHELEAVKYAINNTAEKIYSCYLNGSIQYANNQFVNYYKLDGPASDYKIYDFKFAERNQEQWEELVATIRSKGGSYKYTTEISGEDGSKKAFEAVSFIIQDHHLGEDVIWFFSRDITLRVEQENKIKELNNLTEAILNNIPVYLFVKDPGNGFKYLYWNKAFAEHSQIPASRVLGNTDHDFFPNIEDAKKFRKDDEYLLETKERIEFLETYITANGDTRVVNTSKALIPCEGRLPLIIGVSWDITDLKNTEKELIAARMRAEQSDKLKTAFLANMSHEIRTPLNAIVGFSKLIIESSDQAEQQQYASIVDRNSEMLLQLINDILDISKIEAGTLEFIDTSMDLGNLCRNIYEVHKSRVNEGVTLELECSHKHLQYIGDPNRLSQVITNLITNACKFTHQGEIRFGYTLKKDMLEFFVSDTGVGIPEKKLDSIFNRFIKLNSFAQGTGLGLAISKMIVERVGGRIWVESTENVGSIFRFTLPFSDEMGDIGREQEQKPEDRPVEHRNVASDKKVILIAEDVDSNYLLLKAFLGKTYTLVHAKNGLEAIEKYKMYSPSLILMDIKMPEMNGLEATRAIRGISTDIPIIALTAFAFDSDKKDAFDAGCNNFLTKPVSRTSLTEMIGKYI